jgi:hypothetical protein
MECYRYAAELGIKEIYEPMPKDICVKIFTAKGVLPPKVPVRSIGKDMNARAWDTSPTSHRSNTERPPEPTKTAEIDADELLAREWGQQKKEVGFNEMRAELKAAGVKLNRRWNKEAVKAEWEKLKRGQ